MVNARAHRGDPPTSRPLPNRCRLVWVDAVRVVPNVASGRDPKCHLGHDARYNCRFVGRCVWSWRPKRPRHRPLADGRVCILRPCLRPAASAIWVWVLTADFRLRVNVSANFVSFFRTTTRKCCKRYAVTACSHDTTHTLPTSTPCPSRARELGEEAAHSRPHRLSASERMLWIGRDEAAIMGG